VTRPPRQPKVALNRAKTIWRSAGTERAGHLVAPFAPVVLSDGLRSDRSGAILENYELRGTLQRPHQDTCCWRCQRMRRPPFGRCQPLALACISPTSWCRTAWADIRSAASPLIPTVCPLPQATPRWLGRRANSGRHQGLRRWAITSRATSRRQVSQSPMANRGRFTSPIRGTLFYPSPGHRRSAVRLRKHASR